MKKVFVFLSAVIVAGLFVFSGCEESVVENKDVEETMPTVAELQNLTMADMPDVKVEDGMLVFESEPDYKKAMRILSCTGMNERREWEETIGFESVMTKTEKLFDILHNAETEEEMYKLVQANPMYLEKTTLMDEPAIDGYYYHTPYRHIANDNGMFLYADKAAKTTHSYLLIADKAEMNRILHITDIEVAMLENFKNIDVSNFSVKKTNLKGLPANMNTTIEVRHSTAYNPGGCRNDRAITFGMVCDDEVEYNQIGSTFDRYHVDAFVYAWDKKLCIWVRYDNPLTLKNLKVNVNMIGTNNRKLAIGLKEAAGPYYGDGSVLSKQIIIYDDDPLSFDYDPTFIPTYPYMEIVSASMYADSQGMPGTEYYKSWTP